MIHTLSLAPDFSIKSQPSDWHKGGRERPRKSLQQIVSGDGSRPDSNFKTKNCRQSIKNDRCSPNCGQPAKRPPTTGTVPVRRPRCGREECPSDPESKQGQTPGFGCATEPCLRRGFFLAQPLPNWWPTTASSSTSGACPSAKTGRTTTIRTISRSSTPDLVHLNREAPTRRCRPPGGVPNPANHTRSGTCAEPTTRTIGMCGGWHDATFALLSLQGSGDGAHHRLT